MGIFGNFNLLEDFHIIIRALARLPSIGGVFQNGRFSLVFLRSGLDRLWIEMIGTTIYNVHDLVQHNTTLKSQTKRS